MQLFKSMYVQSFWWTSGVVNTIVVMAAAEGIISAKNMSMLISHGEHIVITKNWARSLLSRMGYVKQKCSTSGKYHHHNLKNQERVLSRFSCGGIDK